MGDDDKDCVVARPHGDHWSYLYWVQIYMGRNDGQADSGWSTSAEGALLVNRAHAQALASLLGNACVKEKR